MDLLPRYFFLNEKLYEKLRVVKSENYIVAWSFEDEARLRFNYSSARRDASKAYEIREVAKLIDRPAKELLSYLSRGLIDPPSARLYSRKNKVPGKWMWSEQDVLDLRDAIFELAPKNKYGEPYTNFKLVSKAELLRQMRGDTSYYVRDESGNYVKVWRAL